MAMGYAYRYLRILDLIHTACMLCALALAHKMASIYGVNFSVSSLIFPLTYAITNIVAIVYSYKYANMVMWRGISAQLPFTVLCSIALLIPSPSNWPYEPYYHFVFNDLLRTSIGAIIGAYCGFKFNIFVLSHSSFAFSFKSFTLQNFFACISGETLFTFIALPIMFYGNVDNRTLFDMMLISLSVKAVYSLILSLPCSLLAQCLIEKERNQPYSEVTGYNYLN